MHNLLPSYIIKKISDEQTYGSFRAFSLFADISGFTTTTEELMKHGEEGAEVLSDILKYLFDTSVKSVYEHGGFITRYAGDAFTALFEINRDDEIIVRRLLQTAVEINSFFAKNRIYSSKFGDFEFGVKIGLACGSCYWGIAGSEHEKSFFFKGDAVDLCAQAEHNAQKGEIWLLEPVFKLLQSYIPKSKKAILNERSYFLAEETTAITIEKAGQIQLTPDKRILYLLAGKKESEFPVGEFREIISVFIAFQETENLQKMMEIVYRLRDLYGGSHPVLDFGDKGGNILLFFGAPVAYENNDTRALNFIWQLSREAGQEFCIRAGLCRGIVYCGFNGAEIHKEFTCLGNTVNQSARFMMKAAWNEIWLDKYLAQNSDYTCMMLGEFTFKGREDKIAAYQLKGKSKIKTLSFNGEFFGRRKEIKQLNSWTAQLNKKRFTGYIYIDGEAGIGKSRIVHELRKQIATFNYQWCHLPCDDIIRKGLNPFASFIKQLCNINEENSMSENRLHVDKYITELTAGSKQEAAERFNIHYAHFKIFLGLTCDDPELFTEEAEERYNNILTALKLFFELYTVEQPLILEFDNAQYLDPDSLKLINQLSQSSRLKPVLFIFGCRFKDNGEFFDFGFPVAKCKRLQLKPISQPELQGLIKDRLKVERIPLSTVKTIHEKSHGNPLFAEQIVYFLTENKILDNKFKIKGDYDIPTGLSQIVVSRFDKLKKNLKELIKTASVLGQQFSFTILAGMLTNKYKNLPQLLLEGENEDIWQAVSEINFLFKYAVVRDVVYDMQLKKTIKELHELSAATIEKTYQDKISQFYEILAYHYDKAENRTKVMQYLKLAAEQAKENFQNKKAAEYFDRWAVYAELELGIIDTDWTKFKLSETKRQLVREYAEIVSQRFYFYGLVFLNFEKSEQLLINLQTITEILKDEEIHQKYVMDLVNYLISKADFVQAKEQIEQGIPLSEAKNDFEKLCIAYFNLGKISSKQGEFDLAIQTFQKSLDYCQQITNEYKKASLLIKVYAGLGTAYDYTGKLDLALENYHQQLEISTRYKNKSEIALATGNIGIIHHLNNDLAKARICYLQKIKLCEELANTKELALTLNNLGYLENDCQNFKKAINYYKQSIKICESLQDLESIPNMFCNLANVLKQLKQFDDSTRYYQKGLKLAEELNLQNSVAEILIEQAELNWQTGNLAMAQSLLETGLQKAKVCNFQEVINKAESLKKVII